jgi:serine protease Do
MANFLNILEINNQKRAMRTSLKIIILIALFFGHQESALAKNKSPKLPINSFADMVEELLPSVVTISITSNFSENKEFGSGFIVSKDGFIATNNHVIDKASEITVGQNNGKKYRAEIVAIDKKTDIALLKINAEEELKFAKFGDSQKARVGDWVIVAGNPYGLGLSVSAGIISAKGRDLNNGQIEEFIQTDAAINNGNSGGPMFDLNGEIIGISTSIISPSGGNIGIGFAIPSSTAAPIVKQLQDNGEVIRGWIGISVQDVSEEIAAVMKVEKLKGAFVVEVTQESPADQAKILPTDIITKIDNYDVMEMKVLPKIISKYEIGKIAKITLLRRGKEEVINVKVARMHDAKTRNIGDKITKKRQPLNSQDQILGIGLLNLSQNIKNSQNLDSNLKGVLVVNLDPKSEAASKGIMFGDVILSINQLPISSIAELKSEIAKNSKLGDKIYLFLKRNDGNYGVALTAK